MRVVGRFLACIVLVTLALLTAPVPAAACSCAGPPGDAIAAVAEADGAFVGTLVDVDDPGRFEEVVSSGRDVQHRFEVEGVAKGRIGPTVVVVAAASGASCGIEVGVGQRAGLLLTRDGDRWRSGLCSKLAPDELAAIASPPRVVSEPSDGRLALNLLVAGVLGAVTVAGVATIEARTRHDPARRSVAGS